jgi:hypothetical protein
MPAADDPRSGLVAPQLPRSGIEGDQQQLLLLLVVVPLFLAIANR